MNLRAERYTPECEHPVLHPDESPGMTGWWEWAERMGKTHRQERCPHCGLWVIWVPRGAA